MFFHIFFFFLHIHYEVIPTQYLPIISKHSEIATKPVDIKAQNVLIAYLSFFADAFALTSVPLRSPGRNSATKG